MIAQRAAQRARGELMTVASGMPRRRRPGEPHLTPTALRALRMD